MAVVATARRHTYHMKSVDRLTPREREHLIAELEIEHRVKIADAGKVKAEIRELTAAYNAQLRKLNHALTVEVQRVKEIAAGIELLRDED